MLKLKNRKIALSCDSYLNARHQCIEFCCIKYAMHCILFNALYYALYKMHCILCIIFHALYTMYFILCSVFYRIYSIHCIPCIYNIHCILCILFYALYFAQDKEYDLKKHMKKKHKKMHRNAYEHHCFVWSEFISVVDSIPPKSILKMHIFNVLYAMYFIHCIPCIVCYALYSMHGILCFVFYALYDYPKGVY
jgi:hypothetical protein